MNMQKMDKQAAPLDKVEENFWTLTTEQALSSLNADPQGLSEKAAQERLKQYGPNSLKGGSTSGVRREGRPAPLIN
jgi:magnesium-transporting ATPase (P-type)